MKKRFIILSAIFAALFSSCTEEAPIGNENSLTGTTTVVFTPNFGEDVGAPDTKAFSETPQVKNLYLAVFTEDGKSLVEYVKADPVLATANDTEYGYSATLTLSDKPRVIHFIANGPELLNYGSEEDAIGSLLYSFDTDSWTGEDAYWGYVELPDGICDEDDSGYSTLCTSLSGVELVRNFAKIQVKTADDSNFELTAFWISNFPEQSSAAPYNRDARQFETGYAEYEYATDAMDALYKGFCPAGSGLISLSGFVDDDVKLNAIKCDATKGWTAYTYEREAPVKDPLCIIAKGHIKGTSDPDTYYKIDLRGADGKYIPILRNFLYILTIGNVEKPGEDTLEDALSSVSSGPIDTNLDLQGLKNMSNGTSKISVSATEVVVFSDDDVTLFYQYIPNVNTTPVETVNTRLESLLTSGGGTYPDLAAVRTAGESYVTITREAGPDGFVFSGMDVDASDNADGARKITLHPVAIDGTERTEVITITGYFYNNLDPNKPAKYESLSRTVNVKMSDKLRMNLKLNPGKVVGNVGDEIELLIGIESNLPQSIFTLDMKIETDNLTLTPKDADLPISTGSTGEGSDQKPVYYVTKAITWDDYQRAEEVEDPDGVIRKYFSCKFLTNTDTFDEFSDGKLGDTFKVTNDYYMDGSIRYLAGSSAFFDFTNLHFKQDDINPGRVVDFEFQMSGMPENGEIDVLVYGLTLAGDRIFKYKGQDADGFDIYSLKVLSQTETIQLKPTVGINQEVSIKLQKKGEFNNSTVVKKTVTPLTFKDLHLGLGTNDYVVVGREAQAKFNMSNTPSDGIVTIYLKNCTPKDDIDADGLDNGFTKYNIKVDDYAGTQYGYDVEFPVIISTGTGVEYAYFKLADDEFEPIDEVSAKVSKLQFTGPTFINGTLDYLLSNGTDAQQLTFTLGDRPTADTGNVILYLKGVTVNDMTSTAGTGTYAGYDKYELNMADATAYPSLTVTLDITPKSGETSASARLSHPAEFDDSAVATVDIKTRYTIDWSKVLIKSDDTGNPAQGNTAVSVYTSYNSTNCTCSGEATALGTYQSFTTTDTPNAGYASATATRTFVDAANGTDKFYFMFTKDDVDYISEAGVTLADLAKTTTTSEVVEVICNIQMVTYNFASNKFTIIGDAGTAVDSGKTVNVYVGSKTGTAATSFTTNTGKNGAFSITCKPGSTIYFKYSKNKNFSYWSSGINVTQLYNGTITSVTCDQ